MLWVTYGSAYPNRDQALDGSYKEGLLDSGTAARSFILYLYERF